MKLFKRRELVPVPSVSVQITHSGLSVENVTEEFAAALVEFWTAQFGESAEARKAPMGFSNDHMSDLESDTMRIGPGQEPEDDDDEEDDD